MKVILPRFAFEAEEIQPYKPEEPPAINEPPNRPKRRGTKPAGEVLTQRQMHVFGFIVNHYARHGEMPTYRMIAESLGSKNPTATFSHLQKLIRVGLLVRHEGPGQRSFEISGLVDHIADSVRTHGLYLLRCKGVVGLDEPISLPGSP